MKTSKSVPEANLPIPDDVYYGTWLGTRVSIPFEGFEVNFQVEKSVGSQTRKAVIKITDGKAEVEEF